MFKFLSRLSDSNEREIRALQPIVDRINDLWTRFRKEFGANSDSGGDFCGGDFICRHLGHEL